MAMMAQSGGGGGGPRKGAVGDLRQATWWSDGGWWQWTAEGLRMGVRRWRGWAWLSLQSLDVSMVAMEALGEGGEFW